jgi:hypothetical protein
LLLEEKRLKSVTPARLALGAAALGSLLASSASARCPEQPPLTNTTGTSSSACPCFVSGEEAAPILLAPAADYPIEITKIRITWGSLFGGQPQSLEFELEIFSDGLSNPGEPQFTLGGPVLTDGFVNEFDISHKIINSGAFTVSLEFLNTNSASVFWPSVVSDANGCTPGRNAVKAIPGGVGRRLRAGRQR